MEDMSEQASGVKISLAKRLEQLILENRGLKQEKVDLEERVLMQAQTIEVRPICLSMQFAHALALSHINTHTHTHTHTHTRTHIQTNKHTNKQYLNDEVLEKDDMIQAQAPSAAV